MLLSEEQKEGLTKNIKSSINELKNDIQKQLDDYKLRSIYTLFSNDLGNVLEEHLRALTQAFVIKEKDKKLLSLLIINETQNLVEDYLNDIDLNNIDTLINIYLEAIGKAFIKFEKLGEV